MRRGRWAEELVTIRAASRDGVISAIELERLGVRQSTTYRRCRDGGDWQLLGPGVVLLSNGTASRRQLQQAALLHGGPGAMITGLDGARLHGLRDGGDPETVHVLISIDRQVRSTGRFLVERTRRLPAPIERDGLPVAPLPRCVLDASRRIRCEQTIAAVLSEAVRRRRVLVETLECELDAGCRKGSATPRRVLRGVRAGVWSVEEYAFRAWWRAQPELPEVRWNVPVYDERGRFVGIADALVEEVGFVWLIDSVEWHFKTPDQVAETERQHRAYREVGLHVLGTRPSQRRDDPVGMLRDVVGGIETARVLPAPRVTYGQPGAITS